MPQPEDNTGARRLITLARRGDAAATAELYRRFQSFALRCAEESMGRRLRRFVSPGDVAAESLAVVFLVPTRWPERTDVGVLLGLIRKRVRWRVLEIARENSRHVGESEMPLDPVQSQESSGPVTRRDEYNWIMRLIAKIPARYAQVVQLCAIDGHSFVEAGRLLSLPADTVRKRYGKAQALVQRLLRRPLDE